MRKVDDLEFISLTRSNPNIDMLNHYCSPYPNYIHQLFITPSKHLYVLKDRRLKWQSKTLEVKLDGIESEEREHIVHYVLADHTSAAFYAEVGTNKTMMNPTDFLIRAWSQKTDYFFHGVPENLIVPTAILKKYPPLKDWLKKVGVHIVPPPSGFYAGVHQVKNWEKDIANHISFHEYFEKTPCTLETLRSRTLEVLERANNRQINRPGIRLTRKQLWEMPFENQPPLRAMDFNG